MKTVNLLCGDDGFFSFLIPFFPPQYMYICFFALMSSSLCVELQLHSSQEGGKKRRGTLKLNEKETKKDITPNS